MSGLDFDREHLWHPYTSMTNPAPTRMVTAASGVRLTIEGQEVIDAMSSWWAAIHGYDVPALNQALRADEFAHVMFGGLTHEPAIALGRALIDLTPQPLQHVFLADSGSVSVEVALKMALQYQRGIGRPERHQMLTIKGGYHGDTFGAMSVCDPAGGMHSMWSAILPEQVFAPKPPAPGGDVDTWAQELRDLAQSNADSLAGLIAEPLLQGAGGMHVYDPRCLQVMREVADEFGLILIFDEIATGFGRTGTFLAGDRVDVTPDILCLGKALTGGYLSAAAALCTTKVAKGIGASDSGVLMHGPTFMGNPLACRVALASLSLLATGAWQAQVAAIETGLTQGLSRLRQQGGVIDVRTIGAVGVVQLDHEVDVVAATNAALDAGVWLRPFRDLIYTMPPYVCQPAEIDSITSAIAAAVRAG
ncbi:MAG TPA: adenosylmethionine--8-amino-7-oxononanoate transaminase [Marmoricola sp.]|nr:adenosylmethionine--8-amino-7-oxononanoate transaminase [Marmoricola sp.]